MNIFNGNYYDIHDSVKIHGIIPFIRDNNATVNEQCNDLLVIEDEGEIHLCLALNKDKLADMALQGKL